MSSEDDLNQKRESEKQGSPDTGEPMFISIGIIRKTHGINGGVIFDPLTDFPERIRKGKTVYVGEDHTPYVIRSVQDKPPFLIICFEGIDQPETAVGLQNMQVYKSKKDLPKLPKGTYYFFDLIGCEVFTESGDNVGIVTDIIETGPTCVFQIKMNDGSEQLVPNVDEFVISINIEQKRIVVKFPKWD